MAASYLSVYLISFLQQNPIFLHYLLEINSMLSFAFLVFFVALFLLFFSLVIIRVISFTVFNRRMVKREKTECKQHYLQTHKGKERVPSIPMLGTSEITRKTNGGDPTHLRHPFLLELLPSDSGKWGGGYFDQQGSVGLGLGSETGMTHEERSSVGKRKKRKAKKKKESSSIENGAEEKCGVRESSAIDSMKPGCLCPFTSSSSAMQRRIKLQYDALMKCHEAKKLTLAQVGNFANSLVEARTELQHKADVIKRKFVITKALLSKADRSSFDRLRKQIYKLELEQKRLEEDALVYNWLQQQLKLSPAYQKMLEIGDKMEWETKSKEMLENTDPDFDDISFEELLAQEKKDAFWQKAGKPRFCSSS